MESGPGLHRKVFDEGKTSFQKYQEIYIGSHSLFRLFRYELTMLLFDQIPGALGLVLRKRFFKPLFKHMGNNVIFGRNLTIRHGHKISMGNNIVIDDNCLLDAKGDNNEGISMGDYVTIGRNSSLICKNGNIKIGSHINITHHVSIAVAEKGIIKIGDNVEIGSFSHFSSGTYDLTMTDTLPSAQGRVSKGIILQDFVWIGTGVKILDDVRIGEKSIIGAGAVVTQDIPDNCIAFGVPAKVVRKR